MVGISSVWDVVPDDGDLYREVFQEHFENTNLQTLKVDGPDKPAVAASSTKPTGRASINPDLSAAACESLRILVLTVDKTIAPPKSKPALHVRCQPATAKPPGIASSACHKPALFGIDRSLINAWAARTAAERPSNVVPSPLERLAFGHGAVGAADGTEWAVLSERDEAHLGGLLELINQTGDLEVGALRDRLEAEHTAHEAANVQAILGSAAAVPRVIAAIDGSAERIDDLALTLDMFDGKLTSMRDDIGSIETRNNSLETQARSLERLRKAVTDLLHTLSAPKEVAALDKLPLSDATVLAAISGVAGLKRKMDSLSGTAEDGPDGPALRREVVDMRAVTEFKGQLQALSASFVLRAGKHLSSVVRNMDVFATKPRVALAQKPAILTYVPLLHALQEVPGGADMIKDVRHDCTSAIASSIAKLMSTCSADTERRIASAHDTPDKAAAYKPVAQLLQDILPPITHALIFAADALALRSPAAADAPASSHSRRNSLVDVSLSQRPSSSGAPSVSVQQVMQAREPLDEHGAAVLAKVTAGGVREPLRRLVRSASARSYVPLVPLFAIIAGWRKHLSQFPAAAPLNVELKEVLLEVTGQLERHQEALVAAAEKQEQPRGAFTSDGKGVKALGVLPQTEALATATNDLSAMLGAGIAALRWWMPWGTEEDIARSESLVRKALEPVGRIVPAVYNAVLASTSKLAAGDTKHGPRLVLENLAALQPPVDALAALAPDVKAPAADLRGNLERARDKVVEEQLQASKLWPLLSFAGRLHVLLREVAPAEVQFQQGYSQASVVSTVETGYSGIDRKVAAVSQRIKKHLSANPGLLRIVWGAVEASLRKTLTQLESDLTACYGDVHVTMTWVGVEGLMKQNAP